MQHLVLATRWQQTVKVIFIFYFSCPSSFLDDSDDDDEMDPEMEEAYEKFCLESERKRKQWRMNVASVIIMFSKLGRLIVLTPNLLRLSLSES